MLSLKKAGLDFMSIKCSVPNTITSVIAANQTVINEVYVFRSSDILLKKNPINFIYSAD